MTRTVTSRPGSFSAYTTLPWSMIMAYLAVRSPVDQPRLFENLASGSLRKSCGLHQQGPGVFAAQAVKALSEDEALTISSPLIAFALPQALITQASLKANTATTSTPLPRILSRFSMYPGRCFTEHPGVKAP